MEDSNIIDKHYGSGYSKMEAREYEREFERERFEKPEELKKDLLTDEKITEEDAELLELD